LNKGRAKIAAFFIRSQTMRFSIFICLICLFIAGDASAKTRVIHKSAPVVQPQVEQTAPDIMSSMPQGMNPSMMNDTMTQSLVQSAMSRIPPQQLQALSGCLTRNTDKATAESLKNQATGGVSVGLAQAFMGTPQGQQLMTACQPEIAAVTPYVMQEFQKMFLQQNILGQTQQ
jgi:hypothetical protein